MHVGAPRVGPAVGVQNLVVTDVHLLAGLRAGEFQLDVPGHDPAEIDHGKLAGGALGQGQRQRGRHRRIRSADTCGHLDRHGDLLFRFGDRAGLVAAAGRNALHGDDGGGEGRDVAGNQPRPGSAACRADDLRRGPGGIVACKGGPARRDLGVVADFVEPEVRHHAGQPLLVGGRGQDLPAGVGDHRVAAGGRHFHQQTRPRTHGRGALLAKMVHEDGEHMPAGADREPVGVESLVGNLGRGGAAVDEGAVEMEFVGAVRRDVQREVAGRGEGPAEPSVAVAPLIAALLRHPDPAGREVGLGRQRTKPAAGGEIIRTEAGADNQVGGQDGGRGRRWHRADGDPNSFHANGQ